MIFVQPLRKKLIGFIRQKLIGFLEGEIILNSFIRSVLPRGVIIVSLPCIMTMTIGFARMRKLKILFLIFTNFFMFPMLMLIPISTSIFLSHKF